MDKEKYLKYINDYNLLVSLYLNKKEVGVFNLPSEEVSFFYKLSTHHSLRALFYKALEFSKLAFPSIFWRAPKSVTCEYAKRTSPPIVWRFFKDVTKGQRYLKTNKYELDAQDKENYSYWSNFMNNQYLTIMQVIKKNKEV